MKQKLWTYRLLLPLIIIYSCNNETADYHPNVSKSEYKITKEIAETKAMELVNEIYITNSRISTPFYAEETIT